MKVKTLRLRMMLLFCTVVGVLLAGSYVAFWGLFAHAVHTQLNNQLLETARPIISDMVAEPDAQDINRLDLPGEFFELLDPTGQVLQKSKNLAAPMDLRGIDPAVSRPTFGIAALSNGESLRLALIPFQQGTKPRVFAVAIPTFGTNRVLDNFGGVALLLLPLSLLLTAGISALYVGRSLAPITELTRHAALMAKRVTNRQGFWTPLPVATPHDELGRLADTFNHLLQSVDSAVLQLRQFVTDASHELRTPLAVLHGETELLLSKPRSAEEYRQTLCVFDGEFKKLTRIVEGLFTLSMADAGQLHLESEPLYINEVLEEACALAASAARKKNISITRDLNQEIAFSGDEAFLHQLFLIFLDNAIKYSPDVIRIHVTMEIQDGVIRARFQDQGIGISSEHLPFIFDRFYRAAPSSSGEAQSGGLGLAIAQAIACAHGGTIECESTLGVGSTFTVVLPVIQPREGGPELKPKQKLILR
ncbi:MAG TPA: ATP-binding protein [Candidatus Dormibacteraeota bacterium]|nr:ATP-binding protein [Candidatus Dormibacteraeota bacterium]